VESAMAEPASDSEDTQQLLDRVRAGDQNAFDLLFGHYRAFLHRVVAFRMDPKLRSRVDVSDVVQETQLEAFRRLDDFLERQPMPFHLWLRKTACERLFKLQRRHVEAGRRAVT